MFFFLKKTYVIKIWINHEVDLIMVHPFLKKENKFYNRLLLQNNIMGKQDNQVSM